ncbi:uncharacterized protein LOC110460386 [Mizuhopecten yessoensis]|uniref:Chitin-binding type-2 domain-containing protein n=1 Tax=Mizuhopecten yessoensis TaxID=6573 RepID=A0A210Q2K4_MIZYE|nr:uncharacterized protein LOC110460386 [Mizuhopecten yessoensis]OWF42967.1 hypothetical protein KP79_PYT12116 [Mizuhopecten yessoensis]
MFFSSILVLFLVVCFSRADNICQGNTGIQWIADPDDCSVFYLCFNSASYKYMCPINSVRDFITKACVPKGSTYDTCTKKEAAVCLPDDGFKPHPTGNCAKYVDCEMMMTRASDVRSATKECDYPLLFDEASGRCQIPETADCGTRSVPKNPCDYEVNQCKQGHCIPCYIRFPSCNELPDGMNAWNGRENTPFFVVCKNERVVYHGQCPKKDRIQLFDPKERVCVPQ